MEEVLGEISRLKSLQKHISTICHHFSMLFKTRVLIIFILSFSLTFCFKQIEVLVSCFFCCIKKMCVWQSSTFFIKWDVIIERFWSSLLSQRKGQMLCCTLGFQSWQADSSICKFCRCTDLLGRSLAFEWNFQCCGLPIVFFYFRKLFQNLIS